MSVKRVPKGDPSKTGGQFAKQRRTAPGTDTIGGQQKPDKDGWYRPTTEEDLRALAENDSKNAKDYRRIEVRDMTMRGEPVTIRNGFLVANDSTKGPRLGG